MRSNGGAPAGRADDISCRIKRMETPLASALCRATSRAAAEMSVAHTSAPERDFFNETAMQPLPVPISRMFNFPG